WAPTVSRAWLISTGMPETSKAARTNRAEQRASFVRGRLRSSTSDVARAFMPADGLGQAQGMAPSYPLEGGWWDSQLDLRSSFTHRGYLDAITRVREYIFAGDIFQSNLSQRFEVPLTEAGWAIYRRLRTQNPAPFAAYLDFPGVEVLSASPERFLRVDVGGHVETRPIKGTRPRGLGPEHDAALGLVLSESATDRPENLMIVDLMRNDLSQVCAPGTVRVSELFALEHYATVHHLVSTVLGDLAPGNDALDLLRAAFPGGSITGAPKVRAMEIIAELEPSQRGVYCGSIGYWSVTGALDTSIAIRTAGAIGGGVGRYGGAGAGAAGSLLRCDWVLERHGLARHEHRHSNRGRHRGASLFQCRRGNRCRFGSRAGVSGNTRQSAGHDRCACCPRLEERTINAESAETAEKPGTSHRWRAAEPCGAGRPALGPDRAAGRRPYPPDPCRGPERGAPGRCLFRPP